MAQTLGAWNRVPNQTVEDTDKYTHTHTQTDANTRLPCETVMMDVVNKGRNQQIKIWPGYPRVRRSYAAARVWLYECDSHHPANCTLRDQNLSFWVVTSACRRNHTRVITLSSWSGTRTTTPSALIFCLPAQLCYNVIKDLTRRLELFWGERKSL